MSLKKKFPFKCDCSAKKINGGVCTCELDLILEDEEKQEKKEETENDDTGSSFDSLFNNDDILNRPSI